MPPINSMTPDLARALKQAHQYALDKDSDVTVGLLLASMFLHPNQEVSEYYSNNSVSKKDMINHTQNYLQSLGQGGKPQERKNIHISEDCRKLLILAREGTSRVVFFKKKTSCIDLLNVIKTREIESFREFSRFVA